VRGDLGDLPAQDGFRFALLGRARALLVHLAVAVVLEPPVRAAEYLLLRVVRIFLPLLIDAAGSAWALRARLRLIAFGAVPALKVAVSGRHGLNV